MWRVVVPDVSSTNRKLAHAIADTPALSPRVTVEGRAAPGTLTYNGLTLAFSAVITPLGYLGRIRSGETVEATMRKRTFVNLLSIIAALALTGVVAAQEHVSFATSDGGTVYADL